MTFPSYRPAAAWKITDTVAFHARGRTVELTDNRYSLVVFVDLGLNFANTGVIGGNGVADFRICGGNVAHAINYRHRPHQKPHFSILHSCSSESSPGARAGQRKGFRVATGEGWSKMPARLQLDRRSLWRTWHDYEIRQSVRWTHRHGKCRLCRHSGERPSISQRRPGGRLRQGPGDGPVDGSCRLQCLLDGRAPFSARRL